MISLKKFSLVIVIIFAVFSTQAKTCLLAKKDLDLEIDFWGFFKPEFFYGDRFTFLNNNIPQDKILYFRHTNDYFLNLFYGKETYGHTVAEFKTSVRNRGVWGSPSSIATTLPAESPLLNANVKEHNHAFPRLFFWMREAWLKLSLGEILHLDFENEHYLTLGAFPFELGRGIALGSAYAVGQGPLGFYSDAMIDQFAFGLKFSGEIIPEVLTYDLYGSILQSRSNTFNETNKPIYKNEIGRKDNPARGFGKDNYLIAARLNWTAFDSDCWGTLAFEPYVMFNNDPEQRVDFTADASSKLGTFGLAAEYIGDRFECGFDAAKNVGHQFVRPWDRNQTVLQNTNGVLNLVNSQVIVVSADPQFNGIKAPDVPKSDGQKAINRAAQTGNVSQNGVIIEGAQDLPSYGTIPGPVSLQNSDIRFRTQKDGNGYSNTYMGYMFVADASYWLYKNEFQIAATGGIASGDQDPNHKVVDGNYKGFIGLQEIYSGKRVKSVFLLGTVGKVKRPGATPENPLANKDFAASASGFTNLAFLGSGFTWKPRSCSDTRFVWNPNIFVYWEMSPGKKFDAFTGQDLPGQASKFLGVELNTFLSYYPLSSLKCFAIGSVFLPGQHFTDIKGKPLDAGQKERLEQWQRQGADPRLIPNSGDNTSYTINIGLEFAF